MKTKQLANLFFIIGVFAYQFLFWKEQMGLNTLLFSGLMIAFLRGLYQEEEFSKEAKTMVIGTLITAVLVVVHNSMVSKIIYTLSFTAMVGFIQQRELRFLWYGFLLGVTSVFETPKKIIHQIRNFENTGNQFSKGMRYFKIVALPLIVLVLFYLLYFLANPKFAELSNRFWNQFTWLFQWDISFFRIIFTLASVFICAGILFRSQGQSFLHRQSLKTDDLKRQRRPKGFAPFAHSIIALKNEYNAGLFLIFALNILLLVVNLTDITYVWFGFDESSPQNLKTYVHEGTWILIFAIILAMGVLLYFFRKNLNFYPNSKYLLLGAYIWILQNVLLTFSVGIRNYRYIDFHGLAYKRIGVILFLLLVFYGLWTMYLKIKTQKTLYFLISKNTWAVYAILLLCSSINWDLVITRYNLEVPTKGAVDVGFMLYTVSDKNLFLLKEHSRKLDQLECYPKISGDVIENYLEHKEQEFLRRVKKQGWQSWNFSDHRNTKYLQKE